MNNICWVFPLNTGVHFTVKTLVQQWSKYERVITARENDLIMLVLVLLCSDIVLPHRY